MVRQVVRKGAALISTDLWDHNDAAYLFHRFVILRSHAVEEACNLYSEVAHANELFEDVLREDVCKSCLSDVVRVHVDLFCSQMQRGSGHSSHSPVCLRHELLLLVLARDLSDNLGAVDVCRFHGLCLQRGRLFVLLLDPLDLLLLYVDRSNFHTEDDVLNL